MKEMIDLGIRVYMQNKDAANMSPEDKMRLEKEEELKSQHTTYLLRLLGFSTDILRCVYDKEKLNTHLVEPSLTYLFERMYPYIILTSIIFILIFLMAIMIIYILIRK